MAGTRTFGISTHLYHNYRLSRDHLLEIAAHGFDRVEVFATRTHFDYQNPAAVADLQEWLADAGLILHGVHAPIGESFAGGRWGPPLNLASPDPAARAKAMDETERALQIARRIPFGVLVTHLGLPRSQPAAATDNSRDAARRSLDELQKLAEPLGVHDRARGDPERTVAGRRRSCTSSRTSSRSRAPASASISAMRTWTATWSTPSKPFRSTC